MFPFVFPYSGDEAPRVRDMPMRRIPAVPAHLTVAAARKVAALKQIAVLLVEQEERIVGTVDEGALADAAGDTPTAAAMKPLGLWLRPAMSAAEARDMFLGAGATILPVIAGGFVLGAVTLADVERAERRP